MVDNVHLTGTEEKGKGSEAVVTAVQSLGSTHGRVLRATTSLSQTDGSLQGKIETMLGSLAAFTISATTNNSPSPPSIPPPPITPPKPPVFTPSFACPHRLDAIAASSPSPARGETSTAATHFGGLRDLGDSSSKVYKTAGVECWQFYLDYTALNGMPNLEKTQEASKCQVVVDWFTAFATEEEATLLSARPRDQAKSIHAAQAIQKVVIARIKQGLVDNREKVPPRLTTGKFLINTMEARAFPCLPPHPHPQPLTYSQPRCFLCATLTPHPSW